MLWLLLACQSSKETVDTGSEDTGSSSEETDATDDTVENTGSVCFSNTPAEPYVVYSTPYDDDGNQVNWWHLQQTDGTTLDFEMGRATTGEVHLSLDGSWGAVAQTDGTIGIFRYLDGTVSIVETGIKVDANGEEVYASEIWLDSDKGEMWITDQNWPNNGGGLFRAYLDCDTGAIVSAERVFSSKNAYSVRPLGNDWVYLSREINDEPYQLSVFDDSGSILTQGRAFDDDESIFSSLASDGTNILVGDNNEFSAIPTRISHVTWDGSNLVQSNLFDVEDPMSIVMIDDWVLIASGYGNQIYQYQLSRQTLSPVMDASLPSLVLRRNDEFYAVANTVIHKLSFSSSGFASDGDVVSLSGIGGIIGAAAVY